MVRSFRRGALAAALALSIAPLAASCAAGSDAATLQVKPDSAAAQSGNVKVQNAYVLTDLSGPSTITARLFNNTGSDQTLQSVELAGGLSATLSSPNGGGVVVPAKGSVLLGGQGNPSAVLETGRESLRDGDVQQAVFTFSGAGPISLQVTVTPALGFFEPYGPASIPTTAAPSPTATGTATPTS